MKLTVQIIAGAVIYSGLAWMFRVESFQYLVGMVKARIGKKE